MKIVADQREPDRIINHLRDLNVEVEKEQLDGGDYIISDRLVVERKTSQDLVQSLYDNRLFDQIQRLCETYEQVILIIENWNILKSEYRSIFGAISYMTIRRNVSILPTSSHLETAHLLERLASWEQEDHDDPILNRTGSKGMSQYERQMFVLQGLEGVGQKTAKRLLQYLGSPMKVFSAIQESKIRYTRSGNPKGISGPLAEISGIGPKFVINNKPVLINLFNQEK